MSYSVEAGLVLPAEPDRLKPLLASSEKLNHLFNDIVPLMERGQCFQGQGVTVTQDMIDGFAKYTLDRQWVHVDVDKAKKQSPFRGTVAHGFLILSLITHLSNTLAEGSIFKGARFIVNMGLDNVRFISPVKPGDHIFCEYTICGVEVMRKKILVHRDAVIKNNKGQVVCSFITSMMVYL